jgi:hypothetical protein
MSADRINPVHDMGHVLVLEAAHHMGDRLDLADIGEELVAEPSPVEAPRTSPAMSTKGRAASARSRPTWRAWQRVEALIGTATSPTFGSMVQNG